MRALLALIAVGLLPGLLLSGATHPRAGSLCLAERLLVAWIWSFAIAVLGGLLLVSTGLFATGPIAGWLAIASAASAFAARNRRCDWRALAAEARSELATPLELAPVVFSLLTFATFFARQQLDPLSCPHSSWNYIADVFAMLQVHGLPEATLHYGAPMGFETNKLGWYVWLGQWFTAAGLVGNASAAIAWAAPATAAAAALALGCLARQISGSAAAAAFATGLALCVPRLIGKFAGLRGEVAGIALLFALLWAVHRSLRERGASFPLLAAAAAACLAMVHLVPAAVAILYAATLVPVWIAFERSNATAALSRAAAAAAVALVVIGVVWSAIPTHPLDAQSAISAPRTMQPYKGYAPSHAFLRLATGGELGAGTAPYRAPMPRSFLYAPELIAHELVARTALPHPLWPNSSPLALAAILLAAGALGIARRREADARVLAQLPLLALALYALGLYFSWRYSTYLPARHPFRREFMYLGIFHALACGSALEALWHALRKRVPAAKAKIGIALMGAAIAVPVAIGGASELADPRALGRGTDDGERAIDWLCANAPKEAPLLFDGSTVGLFAARCELSAVSEGRAAYFQPANLRTALESLEGARRFFRVQDASFIEQRGVEFIVTGSAALGTRPFAALPMRLDPARFPVAATFGEVVIHSAVARPTPE